MYAMHRHYDARLVIGNLFVFVIFELVLFPGIPLCDLQRGG